MSWHGRNWEGTGMGKLGQALAAQQELRKGTRCSIHMLMEQMDPEDIAALNEAMESNQPSSLITRAMCDAGFDVQASTVRRHRRRECTCG